ncbi:MAG: hypothetical protein Ct9H90mP27_6540 [Gammaproteobacteria bacterium]|nr:MAG: hypothetical protein Ct9H90mP27_6540 [Gammaproteobacteria bacterium]
MSKWGQSKNPDIIKWAQVCLKRDRENMGRILEKSPPKEMDDLETLDLGRSFRCTTYKRQNSKSLELKENSRLAFLSFSP